MLENLDNKLGGVNVQLLCFLFIRIIIMMYYLNECRMTCSCSCQFSSLNLIKVFGILTTSITLILFVSHLEIEGSGCKRKLWESVLIRSHLYLWNYRGAAWPAVRLCGFYSVCSWLFYCRWMQSVWSESGWQGFGGHHKVLRIYTTQLSVQERN